MTRKERRAELQNLKFLHTEKKMTMKEETLSDGSIKFQIEGYASTEAKDGSGDVILASGIRLDRFMVNPVLKRGHKRGEENNIGKVTELSYKEDNGVKGLYIKADIILNPEIESHKELIHGIRHNLINGFSIGFGDIVEKYDTERQVNVIESLTLYEISLVDIPDNPLTVRKMFDMIKNEKNLEEDVARESVDGEIVEEKVEETKEEITETTETTETTQVEGQKEVQDTQEEVKTEEVIAEVKEEVQVESLESVEKEEAKSLSDETKEKMTVNIEIEVTDEPKMEEPEAPDMPGMDQNGCGPKKPNMKETTDVVETENSDGNVEVKSLHTDETKSLKEKIVEAEKQLEKQAEQYKADIAEYEKSLKEMVDANMKLLDENKDLKEKVEIAKSFKMKSGLSFQGETENPYHKGRLGNIVKMIQHA